MSIEFLPTYLPNPQEIANPAEVLPFVAQETFSPPSASLRSLRPLPSLRPLLGAVPCDFCSGDQPLQQPLRAQPADRRPLDYVLGRRAISSPRTSGSGSHLLALAMLPTSSTPCLYPLPHRSTSHKIDSSRSPVQ